MAFATPSRAVLASWHAPICGTSATTATTTISVFHMITSYQVSDGYLGPCDGQTWIGNSTSAQMQLRNVERGPPPEGLEAGQELRPSQEIPGHRDSHRDRSDWKPKGTISIHRGIPASPT